MFSFKKQKPVLLLDIDGVLNPMMPGEDFVHVREQKWATWRIQPDKHGPWLRELSKRVTIVWGE